MTDAGLSTSLNNALAGLRVSQQSLAVLSQNIANANTPGYSRKIVNLQSVYLNGDGAGVRVDSVNRLVDNFLLGSIRGQQSVVGQADYASDYADRTQLLLGNPGSNNSLNNYITNFFNVVQSLSQTPEDASLKSNVVQNAVTVSQQITQLAQNLQGLRYQADQDLYSFLGTINNDIKQIDLLNTTIVQNQSLGRSTSELEDQRDQFLNDLATYLPIDTYKRQNGAINISTGGVPLLDDDVHQLQYTPLTSPDALSNNVSLSPLLVYRSDSNGNPVGSPTTLVTGGPSSQVASVITGGKIKGVLDVRDKQIPQMMAQLDVLTANLRDQFNAIHNTGSGFPGANSYTGSHAVTGADASQWSGQVRLAVLDANGNPIPSGYTDQPNGQPPLLLDLSSLDGGNGPGQPTTQSIVNEINQYFGAPQNKVELGNLNNIQIASDSSKLPGAPPAFNFDLDLQNLSPLNSTVYVTGMQVLDDTNTDITNISQNVPSLALDPTNGFVTTAGSNTITVNTTAAHGLAGGDTVFFPADIATDILPATDIGGIPTAQVAGQYFTVSNVTATSFQITTASAASSTGSVASTGATVLPPYSEVEPGEQKRTTADGALGVDLSGNSASAFYTVNLNVGVKDGNGTITTSTISYRIDNNQSNLLNFRYPPRAATGQGEIVPPATTQASMRAMLVDANGNELPKSSNGQYITSETGFLKLVAGNSNYNIAIDSLDSQELGDPNASPPVAATNRGFSYFFGLNNFFVDNDNADDVTNSALNFSVEQRFIDNPNLISTGTLTPVFDASGQNPTYGYQRTVGDQSVATSLANLATTNVPFAAAGGLGAITQTFSGYAGQIISAAAGNANSADQNSQNAQLLASGFTQRSSAISGVNLDEELANTVVLQNAYSASARVISTVKDLFDVLLNAF
jgi:flagellar hook-associated protein FlgK